MPERRSSDMPVLKTSKPMKKSSAPMRNGHCQREHDFAPILEGIGDLTDDVMNRLFDAGCDDATFSMRYGLVFAEFSRPAESYRAAVLSAIQNVRGADVGAEVLRVNTCDLVTPADIARRVDRSRELVSKYIRGDRGPGGFPPPECFLADDKPLWTWCAVSHWLAENQLIRPEEYRDVQFIWVINDWLSARRSRRGDPELVAQLEAGLLGGAARASRAKR